MQIEADDSMCGLIYGKYVAGLYIRHIVTFELKILMSREEIENVEKKKKLYKA